MEGKKIRVGITHGDVSGIGYEVILKTFAYPMMCEMCIPILYGSPKAATYHRKMLNLTTNFAMINQASDAQEGRLNMISVYDEEVKIDFGTPNPECGKVAMLSLERAIKDYKEGNIDVLVTAPINKASMQSSNFNFVGHTEYLEHEVGEGNEALMILMSPMMKVALVTTHLPIKEVSANLTQAKIEKKIDIFNTSLKSDFTISIPRIAVLSLNPHCGDDGLIGSEEKDIIKPAIDSMRKRGVQCFGPYPADGFFGAGMYSSFDGILAMYHDQGLTAFKTLSADDGVNFTAGLPIVRTSPDHGVAYDIAGKGEANENSFRQAIYVALDVWRNRQIDKEAYANPLKIIPRDKGRKDGREQIE
ncbi:MAG TPA: 4-hydroxythreonine-4-phosphate dehydrogenase PdxA [Prevotellaceae bacterium]|jgi:4-hydroxythreonine-4-phosphate dehydrogenase|nr:4-hydroxythreonine-4-phosphate dehydrogenase PdxA [Prevotellaceae bacterium]